MQTPQIQDFLDPFQMVSMVSPIPRDEGEYGAETPFAKLLEDLTTPAREVESPYSPELVLEDPESPVVDRALDGQTPKAEPRTAKAGGLFPREILAGSPEEGKKGRAVQHLEAQLPETLNSALEKGLQPLVKDGTIPVKGEGVVPEAESSEGAALEASLMGLALELALAVPDEGGAALSGEGDSEEAQPTAARKRDQKLSLESAPKSPGPQEGKPEALETGLRISSQGEAVNPAFPEEGELKSRSLSQNNSPTDGPAKDGLETEFGAQRGELSGVDPRQSRITAQGADRNTGKPGKAEETRARDKRKERFSVEVQDQRSGVTASFQTAQKSSAETAPLRTQEVELPVDLRTVGAKTQGDISADREAKPILGFQDMLARELHENLNGDIVRHASVILRDGGTGTIRLALKPETLGNIKIRLEMTENKIAGHIILETKEALRAFEQEIHGLEQAFRDSGFEGASFEMTLASGGGENGGNAQGNESPFFSERLVASTYDAALEAAEELPMGSPYGDRLLVNVLV